MAAESKWKPEFCQLIVDKMKDGASFTEVAAEMGVCKETFENWRKDPDKYPGIADAVRLGKTLSQAFWEHMGILGAAGKLHKFNYQAWSLNMRNRYPDEWSEKTENKLTFSSADRLSDTELDEAIKNYLAKYGKLLPPAKD